MTSNTEKEKIKKYKYDKIYNVIGIQREMKSVSEIFKIKDVLCIIIPLRIWYVGLVWTFDENPKTV